MGPTAPAHALTRAAARNRTTEANRTPARAAHRCSSTSPAVESASVRALALAGVALVVAYIGLVIASLAGVPSIVSPLLPPRAEHVAVTEPSPSAATPSPHLSPTRGCGAAGGRARNACRRRVLPLAAPATPAARAD